MDLLPSIFEFVLHPDQQLAALLQQYGNWIYGVLFAVLFCETGLVVAPFLPGDSLLFVAGALWASADMDVYLLGGVLIVAVLCGDNCNYWIGRLVGKRVAAHSSRFINKRALERTHEFYRNHGGKTVVLARFVPIIRTFAPFVAGLGLMHYPRFVAFSIGGAFLWVGSLLSLGYWFGNIEFVQENFGMATLAVVLLSGVPLVVELLRYRRASRSAD